MKSISSSRSILQLCLSFIYLEIFTSMKFNQLFQHKIIRGCILTISTITIPISSAIADVNDYSLNDNVNVFTVLTASSLSSPVPKNNLLTNPILEGFRKADQVEFDNKITEESNTIFLLLPIINIRNDLSVISTVLNENNIDNTNLSKAQSILNKSSYDTKNMKKIFNQYADNIYYSDPNRANVYLGGGAVPDTSQTQKYLLRNEFITNINNLKDDINMIINNNNQVSKNKEQNNKIDLDKQSYLDMLDDCRIAVDTIQEYLTLVDKNDILLAEKLVKIE